MPVQRGLGAADLDFVVTVAGYSLRIETKVDRKQPSPRQAITIASLVRAGAIVLVIDQHNLLDLVIVLQSIGDRQPGIGHIAVALAADSREIYSEKF